jgi:CHAT domain-containing protein
LAPIVAVWVLLAAVAAGHAAAGEQDEWAKQFEAHSKAGRYAEAEAVALQGLKLAERGSERAPVIAWLDRLGKVCFRQKRYAKAEAAYKRSLDLEESLRGPVHGNVAIGLRRLAEVYVAQKRHREALPLVERALAIDEKLRGRDDPRLALSLSALGDLYRMLGRYADAETAYGRELAIRKQAPTPQPAQVAQAFDRLAKTALAQGHYAEAQAMAQQSLAVAERALGVDHLGVAEALADLATAYRAQARYAEAEESYRRAADIRRKRLGAAHLEVTRTLQNLACVYYDQARYAEAEPLLQQALAAYEKARGPDDVAVGECLSALAGLYHAQARYAEAEVLARRTLKIYEKALGADHRLVAAVLTTLANLCNAEGRYAEAEPLHKRAVAIRERVVGPDHPDVAQSLHNLSLIYKAQARLAEAESLARRALAIYEKALGPEHPLVGKAAANVGEICWRQSRYGDAEPLCRRALAIQEKANGPEHPDVAMTLAKLAGLYAHERRFAAAEPLYRRALAIREKTAGPENVRTALCLQDLARLYFDQGDLEKAEPLVDRAILIRDRALVAPGERFESYFLRAQIAWRRASTREALADLRKAMDLAELQRGQSSGAEHERAEHFGKWAAAFEQMVAWQVRLGDVGEALDAIERGRARSLLDEMNVGGVDLLIGRTAVERQTLRRREASLKAKIASLESQGGVEAALAEARQQLYDHYRQMRSESPVYRSLLSVGSGRPRLSQVQRHLVGDGGLLLAYLFGEEGGYLVVVGADFARLVALDVNVSQAQALAIKPGPLGAAQLCAALVNEQTTGVVQQLPNPEKAEELKPRLAALWQMLVPEAQRSAISGGRVKRLIVVPDGPLALLPFETLVVEAGRAARYLLDVGPPISYAPSATVLYNLRQRTVSTKADVREPVLTLGNPAYSVQGVPTTADGGERGQQPAVGARYRSLSRKLAELPYSAWESNWVAEAFEKGGMHSRRLSGRDATEANLRSESPGRRILHLACHGLADQAYGNFFGALALAPGRGDPADDGFLTLAEIYELKIQGCDLAVLSACETNYGPQQRGEGVWALSRGFLVAGARRVVASNWLVDDEAAASLVSLFCGNVAAAQKAGHAVDYAEALQRAKRWVREQEKWHSPYYWGSFVLVGPN